ncbi:CGNR zinc finger domain-containing protein [Paenibacillus humicola]|uniref:CGNR zinc finger domain-containing protein n=1 Tax=Paenibacillus humicola TaxID=3110540 RepID=UPI00237A5285|nr:CGNR zinc finger domain-containing protein [Paenibacillus humicola]
MESSFIWLGNHAALDFMNTKLIRKGRLCDLLRSFEDVEAWLKEAGFLHRIEGLDELNDSEKDAVHGETLEVRSLLERALPHLTEGERIEPAWTEEINRLLRTRPGFIYLQPDGKSVRAEMHYPARNIAGLFLELATGLLTAPDPGKIKKCSNTKCILHFYDNSRNGSRRWCDVSQCGNRVKVNLHYHRKKAAKRD